MHFIPTTTSIESMQKQVYKTAKEHGWWEAPRSFGDIISLCHSELSEALEEYREQKPIVYYWRNGEAIKKDELSFDEVSKPEGIAVELADVVIRIMDWAENEGFLLKYSTYAHPYITDVDLLDSFGDRLASCHLDLSYAFFSYCNNKSIYVKEYMNACFNRIMMWGLSMCEAYDISFIDVITDKMAYNETRPYRHGGKAL